MQPAPSESEDPWWVVCLCAGWCGVCRDWQPQFLRLAETRPGPRFVWVDVEDEDEAMGDVEIETFPTLLVAQGTSARFLGPIEPSVQRAQRLLAGLQQGVPQPLDAAAQGLWDRLRSEVATRCRV